MKWTSLRNYRRTFIWSKNSTIKLYDHPPTPKAPLHLQMFFGFSLAKWSTWYKEELPATSFQGKFSFNLGSGNNIANLPFRKNVFTLSFNTNLLIPSNASLYITMYNQLYDYQEQREGGEAMPICIIHWKIFKKKQLRKKRLPLHLNKRKKCQGLNLLQDMKLQNKLSQKRD